MIERLKEKVLKHEGISKKEAIDLCNISNKEELYNAANDIRKHFIGNDFDLCSITNAKSGKCGQDCKWCSQSIYNNSSVDEYDIIDNKQAVDEAVSNANQCVVRHSLVTSGRKVSNKTLESLIQIYNEISDKTSLSLCASMGLINEEQMQRLKDEAYIEHYHCNIETAPSFFPSLVSTHTLEEKINVIKIAQKVGLGVCSGGIIGMGESMAQRIEMAFVLKDLKIKSIPINILQPMPGTSLENMSSLSEEDILTTFAIFRFINPGAHIRLAGGRVQIKGFQNRVLKAGVSAALIGDYLTSTGSNIKEDLVSFKEAGFSIKLK